MILARVTEFQQWLYVNMSTSGDRLCHSLPPCTCTAGVAHRAFLCFGLKLDPSGTKFNGDYFAACLLSRKDTRNAVLEQPSGTVQTNSNAHSSHLSNAQP